MVGHSLWRKRGLLVEEGNEAKLPRSWEICQKKYLYLYLQVLSRVAWAVEIQNFSTTCRITTLVTLKGCVRSHQLCVLAVWRFGHSLESAGPRDPAVDSMAQISA